MIGAIYARPVIEGFRNMPTMKPSIPVISVRKTGRSMQGSGNRLEQQVRQWAKRYGSVYVVTGGVLEEGLEEIGEEGVDVPAYFYKIVAKGSKDDMVLIAFLIPNRESDLPLTHFTVEVDTLERLTGLDFFKELSEKDQIRLEAGVSQEDWKF